MKGCSKRLVESVLKSYEDTLAPVEMLKAMMLVLYGYSVRRGEMERELLCGCLRARYGSPAPIVLALRGSPPRGVFLLVDGFESGSPLVFCSYARRRCCLIDEFYHGELFDKVLALIAYAVKNLCSECFDTDAESALNRNRVFIEHLEKNKKQDQTS